MPELEKPHGHFDHAASLYLLGWLMGLEPTTTGITILTFLYFTVLIRVVESIQINNL